MLKVFRKIMLAAMLTLALGGVSAVEVMALAGHTDIRAQLEIEGLDTLKNRWADAMEQRALLERAMRDLGAEYDKVVADIDRLKRGGVDNLERRELEKQLRKGRTLAQELEKLQKQVASLDSRINQIAAEIVERLDTERARLEFELVNANIDEQVVIVETLNEIANERARYARPLEKIDRKDLALILEDADGLEDPGDMLAMADELQDAETEVRSKLTRVQRQLEDLKKRQRLLRRARAFNREERFFEEGDRGRATVARVSRDEQRDSQQDSDAPTGVGNNSPEEGASGGSNPPDVTEGAGEPTEQPVASDDASADPDQASPPEAGAGNNFDGNFSNGGSGLEADRQAGDPGIQDNPGDLSTPETPVDADNGSTGGSTTGGGDPFAAPQDTIVVDRQADPNVSTRNVELGEAELDARIKSLEKDRDELETQADRLKRRAKRLRERAEKAE